MYTLNNNKTNKHTLQLSGLLLIISITSILNWSSFRFSILNNTTLLWCVYAITLYLFFKNKIKDYNILPINLFLALVVIASIHGIFVSRGYWDYKLLVQNTMTFLLPISVYTFAYPHRVHNILSLWFKYAVIIFIILTPFMYSDAFAYFVHPFILPALFFPLLNKKWKYLTIIALIITFVMGFASRSCITRFAVAFAIGYLCRFAIFRKHQFKIAFTLWIAPILFFCLATVGNFNIFKIDEEFQLSEKWGLTTEKTATNDVALEDTRTGLYEEVLSSAIIKDYWLFGHSLARGYYSKWFSKTKDVPVKALQSERQGCESSVLNVFTYMGVVGVILYMAIFVYSSYLGICQSNNVYIPILGVFVAFRWLFGWIEDLASFNFTYIILWIMIAMCISPYFRGMTNKEFRIWFKTLFK